MSRYSYKVDHDRYLIFDGATAVTTPAGNSVSTIYEPLATKIVSDLNQYGMDYHSSESILSWHFTMIDHFARMSHEKVEQILSSSFLTNVDWTCQERHGAVWSMYFGSWENRKGQIRSWLQKASHMQMTAACCIGNAYESMNIAYTLAIVMEKYRGADREKHFQTIAELLEENTFLGSADSMMVDFNNFRIYYGIHLEEHGNLLDEVDGFVENDEEEIDVNFLTGTVTVEQLVGRNFYHYTDYVKDEVQPVAFELRDIDLDDSLDEDEQEACDDDDADCVEEDSELEAYLPEDCWVKRIVDDDDPNTCYLLYLALDEGGVITESGCIEETTQRMGTGGLMFMIPGIELPSLKSFDYICCPPDKVMNEVRLTLAGKALPLDYTFIGKRLPQKMIDENRLTYALQSSHRLAYMHMSIDIDEDSIIEGFDYSSYQSTGSGYGDMFSRPVCYPDRRDEAIDMLLYLYDQYTDEERSCQ